MNRTKKVWIVDDDPAFQLITKTNIIRTGIPVNLQTYSNGKEALDSVISGVIDDQDKESPTVILLDINMPIYDGWYFLDGLSRLTDEIKNKIRLYVCSSSIDPADVSRSESNQNVAGFLEKPVPLSLLKSILSEES